MKALSIRQPWAWAIIHAGKDIENRTWRCDYCGPVLIHAAKGMTLAEYQDFRDFYEVTLNAAGRGMPSIPGAKQLAFGGVIGKAIMSGWCNRSSSPRFFGPYGFMLSYAEPLPFRPLKGKLGFFDVEMGEASDG